jgi:hypothetical protein
MPALAETRTMRVSTLLVALSALASCVTPPDSTKNGTLVLNGVVNAIAPTSEAAQPSWVITVRVEEVLSGSYSLPTFSFVVHSPAMSGLALGSQYKIVAIETRSGYVVDESQWAGRGNAR